MLEKLREKVTKNNDRIAYIVDDTKITYRSLFKQASYYADKLKRQGNSPVILYGHKNQDTVVAILACLLARRTYVVIEPTTPFYRIQKIIEIARTTLILKNEDFSFPDIDCFFLEELSVFANYDEVDNKNQIAYIIFTSGSTGEPKGVPITYKNLDHFVHWISHLNPLNSFSQINVLNQASFSFDLSVADFFYALCNGHTLVSLTSKNQADYNDIFCVMRKNEIHLIVTTPSFLKMCMINPEFSEVNFPFLQCIYFCGEQLEKKLVEKIRLRFPNIKIINAYGPTEATSAVSAVLLTINDLNEEGLLPVGEINTFASNIEIDQDEIVIKGPSVFEGYLNTSSGGHFKEGLVDCFRTGDIGYIKNGKLYCKGRKDNQIKYLGYRIELGEIEVCLNEISGVINGVVVPEYNEVNTVKYLRAFVVLEEELNLDDIKMELEKKLPFYMIPKKIKRLEQMPFNKNYKIDRKKLMKID